MDKRVIETFDNQRLAVLATLDEGFPYSNLVSFAATDDYRSLLFVTPRNTRKYLNLKRTPRVSLVVDNRANNPTDLKKALAITILGEAWEVIGENKTLRAAFTGKQPALAEFASNPQNALFKIKITDLILAGFSQTSVIHLGQPG